MRGERVPEGVAARALRDVGRPHRRRKRPLHGRFVQVKPRRRTPPGIPADAGRREDELPPPLARRVRVLAIQCARERRGAKAGRQVRLMPALDGSQVPTELLLDGRRQRRATVFLSLAPPHGDLPPVHVDVLRTKLEAFRYQQSCAIQQRDNQPIGPERLPRDAPHLLACEPDRQALRYAPPRDTLEWADILGDNMAVQKHKGAQRAVSAPAFRRRRGGISACRMRLEFRTGTRGADVESARASQLLTPVT